MKITVYTDGSYTQTGTPKVGWGYVILDENENILHEDCGVIIDEFIHSRNVTGELRAVMKAITFCEENGIREIDLYHDYIGVRAWVNKVSGKYEWKANNELTVGYRAFIETSSVKINFYKVKAHSKDKWNDYVDKLAKKKF